MTNLSITAGPYKFQARFETGLAPKTCDIFRRLLPYKQRVIHVRWSGEAVWIPLGETDLGIPAENQTSYPAPGQMILYPGGISETEILLPMAPFASPARSGSSPAITSLPSRHRSKIYPNWGKWCFGKVLNRFGLKQPKH